jgi:hypothetical protein
MKKAVRSVMLLIASFACLQRVDANDAKCSNPNSVRIVIEEELSR